jgi:orotate phosphoribosyltransferase
VTDDAARRANETRRILDDCQSIIEDDHFVYVSGDHGAGWIAKDVIFPDTRHPDTLGRLLADTTRDLGAEIVCGPATGGLIVSQWTGRHLGLPSVFSEHDPAWRRPDDADPGHAMQGPFVLRRGYDEMVRGRRVLVVDDIVNTGHSVRQTADAVRAAGGDVVACAAFVTRGNVDAGGIGVPAFVYLLEERIPAWPAAGCRLCRDGIPVNTRYAHGKEWVAAHGGPSHA